MTGADTGRRGVLAAGLAGAAALLAGARAPRLLFDPRGPGLGLNLYVVAEQFARDPRAPLRAVAAIGYRFVETGLDVHDAATLRPMLAEAGLSCSSLNILPLPFRGGMSLETDAATIAAVARLLGARFVTLILFPPAGGKTARIVEGLDRDGWRRFADRLNAKGAEFLRHGARLAYHNHNVELAPRGETNGLEILLEHTDPALVSFSMDAGWVVAAGHDPAALLRGWPSRFRLMHVKDIAPDHRVNTALRAATTTVGAGIVDWRRVLTAAMRGGVRWFAVEQEPPYPGPPIDAARASFVYLSTLTA